jgi:exopolyphosphatase/guanosine-5'-triphosphate,3'-diphosphate pyrophosphatase
MRIAALDLGSNSFHLLVADVHPDGTFEAVAREKEMLRLGDDVTRNDRISAPAADRAVATVRRLKQLADALGATEVLAKATSALRTAANGSEVVDRIEDETGVEVEVISGLEEARLIFAAVRASVVIDPAPALGIDIGGGSVEFTIGDAAGLRWAESVTLGVGRLTAEFVGDDPPSKSERKRLEDHIRATLEPLLPDVVSRSPRMCVGTSGTINDLARMTIAMQTGEVPTVSNGLRVDRGPLLELNDRILRSKIADRRRMPGLEEKRVELLPAGSMLLVTALDLFDVETLTISDWALREGIVLDAVVTHDPDDWSDDPRALRRAAISNLARRCNSDERHTAHVTRLALRLFDETRSLHELGPADREMLEFASMVHDIGQHVSPKGHHRHAAYLVEAAQLRGFAPSEVAFLAALVRHHRRGDPKPSEARFAALSDEDRLRLRKLAALLRVADGLDRGRRGVVEDLTADVGADLVILRLRVHGDAELSLWGARRRRDLFEQVFGREIEFAVTATQNV